MDDSIPQLEVYHLISPRWTWVLVVVVLTGLILHQAVIVFGSLVLLLALALAWVGGRYCLDGLAYRRSFSRPAVPFGEEVTLTVEIVNRKPLPLAWLAIADEVPEAVQLVQGSLRASWKPRRRTLPNLLALRWYERVTRRYLLRCVERGEHVFGPVEMHSGDLFGLATRRLTLPQRQTLLVYPKVVPIAALGLPSRFPLGEERSPHRLWSDPLRVAGIRPYVQGDSVRQVHWKATARAGALQVKTYDPSATLRAMLFLNVDTMPIAWYGIRVDLLELAICATASVAAHLVDARYQVGLVANGSLPRTVARARVPPSRAPQQLAAVLTMLARLSALASVPFADLLRMERHKVPAGATVVIITGLLGDALLDEARAYRAAGHPVSLLLVGNDLQGVQAPGLDVHWIGDEDHWRERRSLRLAASRREEVV
jgi:uncharacterized protein (DUF58 family)